MLIRTMENKSTSSNDSAHDNAYRDAIGSLRESLKSNKIMQPTTMPRILVVDDDPTFGRIMQQVASKKGSAVTYCKSVDELSMLSSWDFDVIVMDYDLGSITGFEVTDYLEKSSSAEVPVILVSQTRLRGSQKWPQTIREFVHKGLGPFAILDAAFEAHEVNSIHQKMNRRHPLN